MGAAVAFKYPTAHVIDNAVTACRTFRSTCEDGDFEGSARKWHAPPNPVKADKKMTSAAIEVYKQKVIPAPTLDQLARLCGVHAAIRSSRDLKLAMKSSSETGRREIMLRGIMGNLSPSDMQKVDGVDRVVLKKVQAAVDKAKRHGDAGLLRTCLESGGRRNAKRSFAHISK